MNERRSTNNYRSIALAISLLLGITTQSISAQHQYLDEYIREGLMNNESIQQQQILLKKNLYALKEARALFLPAVNFGASYTRADGGRTVDMPVGDLMNPVYQTLNQLNNSETFPTLENISIQMNPDDYYDAKIQLSMPIFDSEIYHNQGIKKAATDLQKIEIQIYQRELVKDIKVAYFQYIQSTKAVEVHNNSIALTRENLRINQSLHKNGAANKSSVLRSENEVSKAEERMFSALQAQKNSRAYFNFLLNKPFDSDIKEFHLDNLPLWNQEESTIESREEINKLETVLDIQVLNKKMAQANFVPKVWAFADFGTQGFNWSYSNKTRYYMLGISLSWTLSLGNNYKIKQANADISRVKSQKNYAEKQLDLQLHNAKNTYSDALNSYKASQSQMQTAEKYFTDIMAQYKEGQALYIELLDANNQFINSQLQLNIALYNVYIRQAEVERANASFNLSN